MTIMIGVFDSGFGGLTVLSAFLRELPDEDYLYFGDSARAPYGNYNVETLRTFTKQGIEFLFSRGAKLVILACNTASANALSYLQEEMREELLANGRNILGVIVPVAEAVAEMENLKKVALIATRATVRSEVYKTELAKRRPDLQLEQVACPLLAPMIEEGWLDSMEIRRILKHYLRPLKQKNPQVLIPACTHYPLLHKDLLRIMGKNTKVLDAGEIVAKKLKAYLEVHPNYASKKPNMNPSREFFTSDDPLFFQEHGSVFLGSKIDKVTPIQL